MSPHPLFLAVCLALPGAASAGGETPANAAPASAFDDGTEVFDPIVVTATRTERALSDVPNTVDAIDRERMDVTLVRDLRDLFRYEPGITVNAGFGRFGLGDIRIRGLEGNRVRIQTDGIPVSDTFAIGSFSDANRNFVDLDTLKRVEVVRGPTSSLYGSDALGGVVSFITKDPSDYLKDGKDAYFGLKLGYSSSWSGLNAGATAAFGGERWSGMAVVNHRQGKETENQGRVGGIGATRTQPNPQDRDGRSLLTKLVFAPSQTQRFKLTVEGNEDSADTDVLTSYGFQPLTRATNLSVTADDHQTRARVSFAHEMDAVDAGFADSLDWQIYRQDSETTQDTLERRVVPVPGPPGPTFRDQRARSFNFDQRLYGVQANFRKSLGDRVRHDIAYGIDVSRTQTKQKRDGLRTFLDTGVVTPVVSPDTFPVRDFPISRTTTAAFYIQDEIAFADGAFRLVPAVRVDRYELDPRSDKIFAEDNPGVAVKGLTKTSVSPKLGAVWHLTQDWSLYGGYARGFRSPPYGDVNIGFTNLQFQYTAIANPDLKPETSDGVEAGVRYGGDTAYFSVSGYYNKYRDFIESFVQVGFDPVRQLVIFQSQNVADARIYGVEAKGGLELSAWSESLEGWSLRGAAAYARGDNRTEGVPLDSVDPFTATLGIAFDRDRWGAELAGRFAGKKRRASDPTLYRQAGYGVLDLYAHWNFAPGANVYAGVFNLGDRKYTESGDVALGTGQASAVLDRYTAPGRNLSMSLALEW